MDSRLRGYDATFRRTGAGTFALPQAYTGLTINLRREADMFCPHCGKESTDRVNFCCHCGTSFSSPPAPRKVLSRSRTNRKIAGVCAGFADYLDIDPSLVRILWAALVVFGGCGILAYLIAWIIMPQDPPLQSSLAAAPGVSTQAAPTSGTVST